MRGWVACIVLTATLWSNQAVAQPPEVDTPHLPPEAPKSSPIVGVPLPTEPPPAVVEKPKPAPPPLREKPKPPPVVAKPKPAVVMEPPKAPPAPPAAAPVERPAPKPRGDCEIKPVMSDEDLWNCGASPR